MKSVLVVGNSISVQEMFRKRGYDIVPDYGPSSTKSTPDLVCFTGGEDVSPDLYNESRLLGTYCDPIRDTKEVKTFERYLTVPKVGICRGGQLLNVLSGGALWQDVDNHRQDHDMVDLLFTRTELRTVSTHHQMMIPGEDSYVLAIANKATQFKSATKREKPEYDTEVVWYPKTQSLCVQGHPEYNRAENSNKAFQDYFFDLIEWAFE